MSKVSIMNASYKDCHEAIERIFSLFPLDLEGKKVVIKPNVLRRATPEEGITTHPAVLKAVINEVVRRHPASLIVGDNPGVFFMNGEAIKEDDKIVYVMPPEEKERIQQLIAVFSCQYSYSHSKKHKSHISNFCEISMLIGIIT